MGRLPRRLFPQAPRRTHLLYQNLYKKEKKMKKNRSPKMKRTSRPPARTAPLLLALFMALMSLSLAGCAGNKAGDGSAQAGTALAAQAEGGAAQGGAASVQEEGGPGQALNPEAEEGREGEAGTAKETASGQAPGSLEAVFFDVGKGDCILFSTEGKHVLVDTGYEDTAEDVLEALRARGVQALEAMVVTHYDKDHVGGAARIAGEIPVGTFYLPDYVGDADKCGDLLDLIGDRGLKAVRVSQDTEFSLGDADFKVDPGLVLYDPYEKNDNDASLQVEVFYGEDSWLLPGDIEEPAIDAWLRTRARTYDILKMPHHGRKEDNTADLIRAVSPGIAVITDSDEDEASKKVVKKLKENGAAVFQSSADGTVTVTGYGIGKYDVKTEK